MEQVTVFDCKHRDYQEEYREYLRTYHWQNYRARQLSRFRRCVFCWYFYDKIVIIREVHHVHYENRNHELDEDTVVLCPETHKEAPHIPVSMLIEAYEDSYSAGIVLRSLARLWQASGDANLPAAVASVMGGPPEEGETLLRSMLEEQAG